MQGAKGLQLYSQVQQARCRSEPEGLLLWLLSLCAEIFHLFVIFASTLHFVAVAKLVLTFDGGRKVAWCCVSLCRPSALYLWVNCCWFTANAQIAKRPEILFNTDFLPALALLTWSSHMSAEYSCFSKTSECVLLVLERFLDFQFSKASWSLINACFCRGIYLATALQSEQLHSMKYFLFPFAAPEITVLSKLIDCLKATFASADMSWCSNVLPCTPQWSYRVTFTDP